MKTARKSTLLILALLAWPVTADTQARCAPITCDATGDTSVGTPDFAVLTIEFGDDCNSSPQLLCAADCTGDTVVGSSDFAIMTDEFGNTGNAPEGREDFACTPR